MGHFSFEFTDTRFTIKLLGRSFLSFVLVLIAMAVTINL
jgi:hypothetical protein